MSTTVSPPINETSKAKAFDKFHRALNAYQAATAAVDEARQREVDVALELTVFRGYSTSEVAKLLGYRTAEGIGKRVRPDIQTYGLEFSRGYDVPAEKVAEMEARYERPYAGHTNAALVKALQARKVNALDDKAARVLHERVLPAASELVTKHRVSLLKLGDEVGMKRELFRTAIHAYWTSQGIAYRPGRP